tara:strand:- start:209 stop:1660 length:1452 start_codon:yes stop_codon:yes gene_type:complete
MIKNKKKIIFFSILLFLLLAIIGWFDTKNGRNSILGKYIPDNFKTFLKKTIFIIPQLQNQIVIKNKQISELSVEKIKTLETWNTMNINNTKVIAATQILSKKLIINNNKMNFEKFLLPLPDYYTWKMKSVGYIDKFKNNYFFVSGDGKIFFFNKNVFSTNKTNENKKLKMLQINSNFLSFADKELSEIGKLSVKDILIKNKQIFISFINKKKENCHNIEIVRGEINFDFINFTNFFTYNECFENGNVHSTGGRMVDFDKNKMLFSIGEGLNRSLAQNKNSVFGKIIKINTDTKEYKTISMGHRNPQGLFYDKEKNIIVESEHGPDGGDEINVIKFSDKINNYGWPISSYGEHYQGQIDKYKKKGKLNELLAEAPLHKSHSKYSFEEPIKYFTPSIGISEIIKIPSKNEITSLDEFYFVGSMGNRIAEGDMSLHYFKLNSQNQILNLSKVVINERVRDIIYDENNETILMVLENSPALGIIYIN